MTISAIPTKYAGVQFRSRLEARWAAFFDLISLPWEYEPIDLDGYIPDFILSLKRPLLVEVKPILRWPCAVTGCHACHADDAVERATYDDALTKIRNSGWADDALLVGAVLNPGVLGVQRIGRQLFSGDARTREFAIDTALAWCAACRTLALVVDCWFEHSDGTRTPTPCMCGGDRAPYNAALHWREAGNRVQWRGGDSSG